MLTEGWIGDDLFLLFLGFRGLGFFPGLTLWPFLGLLWGTFPLMDDSRLGVFGLDVADGRHFLFGFLPIGDLLRFPQRLGGLLLLNLRLTDLIQLRIQGLKVNRLNSHLVPASYPRPAPDTFRNG